MQRVAVIGLGRFGMELAKALAELGIEVIAIDTNGRLIEQIRDDVALAVRMDATDVEAMQAQEVDKVDVAVVGIGQGFGPALLVILGLKQLGVAQIVARAEDLMQATVMERIGADQVILPELETARRLADRLVRPQWEDHIALAPNHRIVQLRAPAAFHHKTLTELDLRRRFGVNVVAIKHERAVADEQQGDARTEQIVSVPRPDDRIGPGDVLILVGPDEALARLPVD